MTDFLEEFRRSFRVADAADILLLAAAIYFALVWLQRAASRSVFVGIAVLAAVYFLAGTFDLSLTLMLFNAAFAVVLVALVVVFQEDLRRAFERIASLGRLPRLRGVSATAIDVDVLVESAFALAAQKRGALIVLKGTEDLRRHVDGGVRLDGRVSKPLLYSIFDPNSAGHDGAVLIEDNLLTRFAAHLPLARERTRSREFGTRHSAAIGLSECCDALVVVVSEERGVVSVAERGELKPCVSAADLKQRIEHFLSETRPATRESLWRIGLQAHFKTKVAALLLACCAWFAFVFHVETIQRTFVVPIEYRNVPAGEKLGDHVPTEAQLTLSGPSHAFRFLAPSELTLSIDLAEAAGQQGEITLTDKHVRHPPNLAVYRIEPAVIRLRPDLE